MLAACPRPACQGQPETLTHLFLACPSSQRVLALGLSRLDAAQWQPGTSTVRGVAHGRLINVTGKAHVQPLWTQLRTLARQEGPSATSVAARLVHQISHAGLAACARQQQPGSLGRWRLLLGKGRQPFITLEQFQQHWGQPGALYQLAAGALPDSSHAVDGATPHAHNGAWGVTGG